MNNIKKIADGVFYDKNAQVIFTEGYTCAFCNTVVQKGIMGLCMNPDCEYYNRTTIIHVIRTIIDNKGD